MLVGFYGTETLYRLYSAGQCRECENECACRVGGVVPPCTLEQWVNSSPPIPLGVCAEFDGGQTILQSTLSGSGHILSPLTHRGNTRHYDIILNRQIVPTSMQYECV